VTVDRVQNQRILLDFAVTPDTEGLQQFALDLVECGYTVRCSLWRETEHHRVWPEVAQLERGLEGGEAREEIGVRLSHADSYAVLSTRLRLGITAQEELEPRGSAEQFNAADGLLVVSRSGWQRLCQLGVEVPMAGLSVEGLRALLRKSEGPLPLPPIIANPSLAQGLGELRASGEGVRVMVLADAGQDPHRARREAVAFGRQSQAGSRAAVVAALAVQSGPVTWEDGLVILGRHQLLPTYQYLEPAAKLVAEDLVLGLVDLLEKAGTSEGGVLEVLGRLPFERRLRSALAERGWELQVGKPASEGGRRARRRVAVVGPYNVPCGVAEEIRLLHEHSPRPLSVFSEKVDARHLVRVDDSVPRCYERDGGGYGELLQALLREGIDVVHVEFNHGLFSRSALMALAQQLRTLGVHTVVTLHSATEDVVAVAKEFDEVIVNTAQARERLCAAGMTEGRVRAIPLPARPLEQLSREKARERVGIGPEPVIATCGFAFPHKGLLELIQAVAFLRRWHPRALLLLCCPSYPGSRESAEYLAECRRTVEEWGLQEDVQFRDEFVAMEELGFVLQAADVLAFPYTSDARQDASGALRMVLAAGRPTVVSDLPIFEEVGAAVLRVPPSHVPALVRAFRAVLADAALGARLGEAAQLLAEQWTPSEIARRHWCEVYRAFGDTSVHLEGVFQSSDSFAQVLANLALGLGRLGCDVSIDAWSPPARGTTVLPAPLGELADKHPTGELTVRMSYPHRPRGIPGRERAIIVPWEVTRLPEGLAVELSSQVDWVLAPSRFGARVLTESGVDPEKVRWVPHGVDRARFHPEARPVDLRAVAEAGYYSRPDLALDPEALFVFLHLGSAGMRKGTDVLLSSYCAEFTGRDDVLLVLKSFGERQVERWIREAVDKNTNPPRIVYLSGDTPGPLMPSYYTASDCLVHPCRGEGFGLPVLEAMACGRPAIVTNWSGPIDFCDTNNAYLLGYELAPARDFHVPVPPDALWAEPKVRALRSLMRRAFEQPEELRQKGARAAEAAACWTWDRSAYCLLQATGRLPMWERDA